MLEPVRPEFVFLDMGNVIVSFDRDRAFRQMAEVSGGVPETIRAVVMEGGLHDRIERGEIDWPQFHGEFSRRTGTTSNP